MTFPSGKALVQTVDFFTPVVNDPFRFGQIAAANALSDVYAMGGEPFAAMNIVCFPAKCMSLDILKEVLRGGFSKIKEAGAAMAGGHSVEDSEIKYGVLGTAYCSPNRLGLGFWQQRSRPRFRIRIDTRMPSGGLLRG
ncbi:MAG: selenide water [Desulfovibrionaceae bacterium]|nr:MAG: selenide water [Desulfovibrionaceae bacterium]